MQTTTPSHPYPKVPHPEISKLEDFGKLQERYLALGLASRAQRVLADAEPSLQMAERILNALDQHPKIGQVFEGLRKNHALMGKMRASEAKNILLDGTNDFLDITRHKLLAWRKTMERIGAGEGIVQENSREYIPPHMPVAVALSSICTASGYLGVVQLALADLAKNDSGNADRYHLDMTRIRRCATLLSDCENASSISALVN